VYLVPEPPGSPLGSARRDEGRILGCVTAGQWSEDGLDLAVRRAVLPPAFLQRRPVVPEVAEAGVGTMGEQSPNAGGAAVACCCMQRQASPVAEVDSVLPADPVAPSSTGHRFYQRRRATPAGQ
jgi:hypothetical protein